MLFIILYAMMSTSTSFSLYKSFGSKLITHVYAKPCWSGMHMKIINVINITKEIRDKDVTKFLPHY